MTDNQQTESTGREVELRRETAAVARTDTDSWAQVIGSTAKLADYIAGTEFVPRDLRGKPAAVAAAILYGREVGLPPMTALTQTHVIEGKPSTSAEGMRALVIAQGHELVVVEATGAVVTMRARRRGTETWTELSWTIDMARAAGLAHKDVWKKYPRAMLAARCTDELCGLVFPDVVHGLSVVDPREVEETDEPAAETTVSRDRTAPARKRATRKRKPPEPVPTEDGGLPLPGEDGYEEPEKPAETAGETPEVPESTEQPAEPENGSQAAEESTEVPGENDTPGEATDEENGSQPAPPSPPRLITRPQSRMLLAALSKLADAAGVKLDREERLRICAKLTGRDQLESGNELTKDEASSIIDTLSRTPSLEALLGLVDGEDS